jgi:hypothetical protein
MAGGLGMSINDYIRAFVLAAGMASSVVAVVWTLQANGFLL